MSHTLTQHVLRSGALAIAVTLAGCASLPQAPDDGALQREAMAGTHAPVPPPMPLNASSGAAAQTPSASTISRGSGEFIRPQALATPACGC